MLLQPPKRRPRWDRGPPCPPNPPNRIRHNASSPSACQKPSCRQPNSGGSSQFHRRITTSPPTNRNATIPRIASGAIPIPFFFIFIPQAFINSSYTRCNRPRRRSTAWRLRESSVFTLTPVSPGDLLKAAPFKLMRNKHLSLFIWQFVKRQFQFVEKQVAGVKRLRSGIGRGQQVFELQRMVLSVR